MTNKKLIKKVDMSLEKVKRAEQNTERVLILLDEMRIENKLNSVDDKLLNIHSDIKKIKKSSDFTTLKTILGLGLLLIVIIMIFTTDADSDLLIKVLLQSLFGLS